MADYRKQYGPKRPASQPVDISAPYGFVPIADSVFSPEWSRQISQDIPFSDGICGTIEFDMVADSPIGVFAESGSQNNTVLMPISTPDGRYFIPATTLKGEIRSVLDILGFGRIKNVKNSRYGMRNFKMTGVHCGWMRKTEDGIVLTDQGEPGRISLETIDKHFGTNLARKINDADSLKKDENRTAKHKYDISPKKVYSEEQEFIEDKELQERMSAKNRKDKRDFYRFADGSMCYSGRIVFTGQPGIRKKTADGKMTGKAYEFIFFDLDGEEITYSVKDSVFKDFESIHSRSSDYVDFWKPALDRGECIPVFFLVENGAIHSIGLSYMYKYPYKKSVYDAIPRCHLDLTHKDLGECIFGYTSKEESLRGRVQFSHAMSVGDVHLESEKALVLSTPHSSFFPFYVEGGKDWNNALKISGHKRYPVRSSICDTGTGSEQMISKVRMCSTGTTFHEIIRFHNLRPIELGALLSAITFHNNSANAFHSIGHGKPFGYGKIRIDNLSLNDRSGEVLNAIDFMARFESAMNSFLGKRWVLTPQVTELVMMARGIPAGKERGFSYLKTPKEFVELKKQNAVLEPFSKRVSGVDRTVSSLLKGE